MDSDTFKTVAQVAGAGKGFAIEVTTIEEDRLVGASLGGRMCVFTRQG